MGRPVRVAGPGGGPAEGVFDEAQGVLDVEAVDVGPPADVKVGGFLQVIAPGRRRRWVR